MMRSVHAFPVKRNNGDLAAIRTSLGILKSGRPLVIFPEGTRSKDTELKHGKPGIGFIVSRSGVPVIPAYIEGSFDALPRGLGTLNRHPVRVYIGKPVIFDDSYIRKRDKESYQKISDEMMRRIAQLKDQYAGKPR